MPKGLPSSARGWAMLLLSVGVAIVVLRYLGRQFPQVGGITGLQ